MKGQNLFLSLSIICILVSCSFEPSLPIIQFNQETSELTFIQTDTTAHDTAVIKIDGVYKKRVCIKDTVTISLYKIVQNVDQLKYAYLLATHDNTQQVHVCSSRSNDTIFTYSYKAKNIPNINIAKVVYGNCIGLCNVNQRRNYTNEIKRWIFNNNINPDSALIDNMNSLMKQFNNSGRKEYAMLPSEPLIVKSIIGSKYKFDVNLPGKYFFLYPSQDGHDIKSFVEKKISEGLKDAHFSSKDEFICDQQGEVGPNCLFMIGIDDDWKYSIIPLGIVVVDYSAPHFSELSPISRLPSFNGTSSLDIRHPKPQTIYFKNRNLQIDMPQLSVPIKSDIYITYKNFSGNNYSGYNIPFDIKFSGDVEFITIGPHKLYATDFKPFESHIRLLHFKHLYTGHNSIPVTAIDVRGNKSTSSINISLTTISSNYDDDYDELNDKIYDLEDRINNLE